jgi:hypothetical protein
MTERKPDFLVRTVKEVKGKQQWTGIGMGFANESGTITIFLSALPLGDKLILMPNVRRNEKKS